MKNKGQTTVLFSLMISVLLLFTLTALEVGRIYMSRVKNAAVVHSARTSIMADYHQELFERYHLLFFDPTYGTGSVAVSEERIRNYIEESLNDGSGQLYQYDVEDIALMNETGILEDGMGQLKEQIREYEKTAGVVKTAEEVLQEAEADTENIKRAQWETEQNGQEIPNMNIGENISEDHTEKDNEVADPRETLKESLKFGILSFVLPDNVTVSRQINDYSKSPSKKYTAFVKEKEDISFSDFTYFKGILNKSIQHIEVSGIDQLAFADYVEEHFSNVVRPKEDSVVCCEVEYIIAGKNNDYDNVEAVVNDITWMRMPVNYAYLLTDNAKKSEALTVAAAICTATGTPEFMEIVKYLLLGCWAYGESLHEVRLILAGQKIPYVKNSETWYTDLKSLAANGTVGEVKKGMNYESFLLILLTKEAGKDIVYARMLDVMEKNLQVAMPSFRITDLIGSATIQGKITVNPMFVTGYGEDAYAYYFEESFSYTE